MFQTDMVLTWISVSRSGSKFIRYLDGQLHPYSLALGRRIKQRLWEHLEHPTLTKTVRGDGLVRVGASYRVEHYPPQYEVDT
ncbi:hypothetical protein ABVT39_017696 [Epinephelus coioides]